MTSTVERYDAVFLPSFRTMFTALSALRLIAASLSPIHDCDEVYNYYEPLHFIMHGSGLQTWEVGRRPNRNQIETKQYEKKNSRHQSSSHFFITNFPSIVRA
jgi:hypothetical protein